MELGEYKATLQKLKRNREQCQEETLRTKYKKAYDEIRDSLKTMTEEYMQQRLSHFKNMVYRQKDEEALEAKINKALDEKAILKRISNAVYQDQDFNEIEKLAAELEQIITEIWQNYFSKFTCLYCTPECFMDNPQTPRFYNDLVDKFYDESTGEWITK